VTIDPIDIWRSAKLIVSLHDRFAPQECRRVRAAFADKDDGAAGSSFGRRVRKN
jgi:hypothetical protein